MHENSDDCWNNKCDECKGGKQFIEKFPLFDISVEVTWYRGKINQCQVEKKVQKIGKADVLYDDLTLVVSSAQLFCRLTFMAKRGSVSSVAQKPNQFLLLPFGKVRVVPRQWLCQTIVVILGTVIVSRTPH